MELDKLIEQLNKKIRSMEDIAHHLEQAGLTEAEETFMKVYQPEKALIIYGSLAPGQSNHHVVEFIKGTWQKGVVRGKVVSMSAAAYQGYNGFVHTSAKAQTEIPVYILHSGELPVHWPLLDAFEGAGYQRVLAKYESEGEAVGVGYIYAINEQGE